MGIGGFMSVIGENLKAKHDKQYEEEKKARDTEISIYTKIIGDDKYSPEQQTHAAEKIDEIMAKMGKGKGKSPVAKFSDIAKHIIQHGAKKDGQQQGAASGQQQSQGLPPIPQQKDAAPQSGTPDQYAAKSGGQVSDQLKRPSFSSMTVPMTPEQRADRDNSIAKKKFEDVEKPAFEYEQGVIHKNRMEEAQARPSAFTNKSIVRGDQLTDSQKQNLNEGGYKFDPKGRYKIDANARGEEKVYPSEQRVMSASEQKTQEKVENRMAATGEDQTTAEKRVRSREEFKERQSILEKGAQLTKSKLSIQRTQQIIAKVNTGEAFNSREARVILSGAMAQARARKADVTDEEAFGLPFDQVVDIELRKFGTNREEINRALKPGAASTSSATTGAKPRSKGNPLGLDIR